MPLAYSIGVAYPGMLLGEIRRFYLTFNLLLLSYSINFQIVDLTFLETRMFTILTHYTLNYIINNITTYLSLGPTLNPPQVVIRVAHINYVRATFPSTIARVFCVIKDYVWMIFVVSDSN